MYVLANHQILKAAAAAAVVRRGRFVRFRPGHVSRFRFDEGGGALSNSAGSVVVVSWLVLSTYLG